jgi:hypothetical protein
MAGRRDANGLVDASTPRRPARITLEDWLNLLILFGGWA